MGDVIDLGRYRKEKAKRIFLLAEKDPFLAPIVGEFLKHEFSGIAVVIAENEADILSQLQRRPPALLIINLDPDEGAVVEILQAVVRKGRKFPIIVTSTHIRTKNQAVQVSGVSAAGFAFLLKPYSLSKLADTIRSLVDGL